MKNNLYIYIFIMWAMTYLVRVLPLTLIRRKIENRFLRSFLGYVPYVTLSVMIFPAIIEATQVPIAGWAALLLGIALALRGVGLFGVAASCCGIVFLLECILV